MRPTWKLSPGGLVTMLALAIGVSGCGASTRVQITSRPDTNDGSPFYMMIRTVDKTVAAEQYQEVAVKAFSDPPDPTVLVSKPIIPGVTVNQVIEDGDKKDVVIYFFFTNPGPNWRQAFKKPLPSEIYVDLETHQIKAIRVRKR